MLHPAVKDTCMCRGNYWWSYVWIQVSEDELNLNGTHQFLVYADGVNILVGSVHTVEEKTEILIMKNKESGVEVNADKHNTFSCIEIRMQDEVTV